MTQMQQGFPQISSPLVDPPTGRITTTWLYLLQSLWNRTGAAQGGVVNSVTVNANEGITETVQSATSNVLITLGLGAITPSSVAASGNVTGSNLSGTNTGNVTLLGENYLSLAGQAITAHPINLSGTNVTGEFSASNQPALTGDVTTPGASLVTTLATVNSNVGTYTAATITVNAKGQVTAAAGGGGISATITTAKLTGGGANGSLTFVSGVLTAQVQAT